ncbi:hypothetical protein Dimus_011662 [Dionaea muscipula]
MRGSLRETGGDHWQDVGRKMGAKQVLDAHDQRQASPSLCISNRFGDLMGSETLIGQNEMVRTDFVVSISHDPRLGGKIDKARTEVEEAQLALRESPQTTSRVVLVGLTLHLKQLLRAEDFMIKQRLKGDWLRLNDRITRYFYSLLRTKSNRNHISRLMRDDELWVTSKEKIVHTVSQFYSSLLGTNLDSEEDFDRECFGD